MNPASQNRRQFLTRLGMGAIAVGAAAALNACGKSEGGAAAAKCEDPTGGSKAMREQNAYVDVSVTADQKCDGCALYVAGDAGCGKCTLFANTAVAPGGWCKAWAKKA
jgi:hypothetical protein